MKIKKYIFIFIVLIVILLINTTSFAINPDDYTPGEINNWEYAPAMPLAQKIMGGITTIGTVVAVVVVIVLGIKYMMGSVEEKAEYKNSMVPIIIGMIMLFGISGIIKLIYNIAANING